MAVVTLMFLVTAAGAPAAGPTFSWAIPIVTALIVLAGTIAGLVMNRQTAGQRLAFERVQWEATENDRKRKVEREEEERARAHAAEVQHAVEAKCGECMEEVRRLIGDLDAATGRLLAAHRLIGQKDAKIETLESELAERGSRDGHTH